MSYTPPPPPEVPNRPPTTLPPAQAQVVPTESVPQSYAPVPVDPAYAPVYGYGAPPPQQPIPVPGSSGCRWGCITVLVAMFAVVVLIGAVFLSVLTSGANTFGGIGNTIGNLLGTWANAFSPARRVIVLPEVERLQKLARVTTVKFNYAGVVTVAQDVPPLLGALYGNSQVLVAVVSVQAGIDLSTLDNDDYVYDEATNTITLTLPAPMLQECFMDDSKSYVVENNTGIFVGSSPALDDAARRYAIQQFRVQAQEEGILAEAQTEAQGVITDFVGALNPTGGPTIQLNFAAADPNAALPATCQ